MDVDALACRIGLGAAAGAAVLLARYPDRFPRHRPVAVALGLLFSADLARAAIAGPLDAAPVPYTGTARALFHVDWALVALFPAVTLGLAVAFFLPWRRPWHLAAGLWVALCGLQIAAYPTVRGARLGLAYAAVHVAAGLAETGAAGLALASRGWRAWSGVTRGAVILLIVGDLAAIGGPFLRGRPIDDWLFTRWQTAALWWILAAWQGRVLCSTTAPPTNGSASLSAGSAS